MVMIHKSPNEAPITELFAFLSVDDKGNEGIIGVAIFPDNSLTPCVSSKLRIIEKMRPLAEAAAKIAGVEMQLVRFTRAEAKD